MSEQNPDIPFVVHTYNRRGTIHMIDKEAVDRLILDPKGALLCESGVYCYIPKNVVRNDARTLRDSIRSQSNKKVRLVLEFNTWGESQIDQEIGNAIEAMATEIKTLQKKCEESHNTTSGCS